MLLSKSLQPELNISQISATLATTLIPASSNAVLIPVNGTYGMVLCAVYLSGTGVLGSAQDTGRGWFGSSGTIKPNGQTILTQPDLKRFIDPAVLTEAPTYANDNGQDTHDELASQPHFKTRKTVLRFGKALFSTPNRQHGNEGRLA
jgi:hypothetical protein